MFFFIANEGSKDGTLITPHNFAVQCFTTNRLVSSQYRFHKEVDSGLPQLLVLSERETN